MSYLHLNVSDVMSRDLVTAEDSERLSQADADMRLADIRHLPVVDNEGELCGILSDRDVYKALANNSRGSVLVSDVMTRDLLTLREDQPIHAATELMLYHKIGAAPILDSEDKLVGIVTETDVLRIAHGMLGGATGLNRA